MFVKLFHIVNIMSSKFNIDESHGLLHSMQILHFANDIYENEKYNYPILQSKKQQDIIYTAAILHDMCDKKYMNESEGIVEIHKLWKQEINYKLEDNEIMDIATKIIRTMSYSKVKVNGFPKLGKYQLAYHIVREADLLAAYDIDRCIMYSMYRDNIEYTKALTLALNLFDYRVFKMRSDRLFVTKHSKKLSLSLHKRALKDVANLKEIAN